MATHSSVFAWRIPGTGEPCGLPSMGSHRVRHDWSDLAAAAAKKHHGWVGAMCLVTQSCPTLCNSIVYSLQGSSVHGFLQARILQWVAISFSNAWKWKVKVKSLSCVRLLATSWTTAYQAPPSVGFSRQEYWSGVPLPSPNISHRNAKIFNKISSWIQQYNNKVIHHDQTGFILGMQDFSMLGNLILQFIISVKKKKYGNINRFTKTRWQYSTSVIDSHQTKNGSELLNMRKSFFRKLAANIVLICERLDASH